MDFCPFDHLCGDAAANREERVGGSDLGWGDLEMGWDVRMGLQSRRVGVFSSYYVE